MKPSVLFSGDTGGAATKPKFNAPKERATTTIFARGLAGAESIAIEVMAADKDPDEAVDADYVAFTQGGNALVLDTDNTILTVPPGSYRAVIPDTAGAIFVGLY